MSKSNSSYPELNDHRLESLVRELWSEEGTDFEGGRTYRVHIKTAERIVRTAYRAGLEDARNTEVETEVHGDDPMISKCKRPV